MLLFVIFADLLKNLYAVHHIGFFSLNIYYIIQNIASFKAGPLPLRFTFSYSKSSRTWMAKTGNLRQRLEQEHERAVHVYRQERSLGGEAPVEEKPPTRKRTKNAGRAAKRRPTMLASRSMSETEGRELLELLELIRDYDHSSCGEYHEGGCRRSHDAGVHVTPLWGTRGRGVYTMGRGFDGEKFIFKSKEISVKTFKRVRATGLLGGNSLLTFKTERFHPVLFGRSDESVMADKIYRAVFPADKGPCPSWGCDGHPLTTPF